MPVRLKLSGAWDAFLNFLNPSRAKRAFQEELRRKVLQQVILLRADVIKYIDTERHGVPNSPLTIMVKKSSRPLVDKGDLRQSINAEAGVEGDSVVGACGVLRSARGKGGKSLVNVAQALHNGFRIKVTEKVRRAIFAEMRKRAGGKKGGDGRSRRRKGVNVAGPKLSGEGAATWVVRGRPFILEPFLEAEQRIMLALGEGVRLTLKKL